MRVLFCGLGSIGQRHLRALKNVAGEELEVHAYRVRRNPVTLRDDMTVAEGVDVETEYDITTHLDLGEALAAAPEAAFICNPTALHVPVALACVNAGVDVFLEKPVSHSWLGIDELIAAVADRGSVFQVGFNYRFHPALQRVKRWLADGRLGRIVNVYAETGEYLPGWHSYEDFRTMYAARADQGGGVILTQIHELDILQWFFGVPESIVTHGGTRGGLGIDVDDCISSLLRYTDQYGDFAVLLHQDFLQKTQTRTMRIVGDEATATADLVATRLVLADAEGGVLSDEHFSGFTRQAMFEAQIEEFLSAVRKREQPTVDLDEALKSQRMALASLTALTERREVNLKEVVTP